MTGLKFNPNQVDPVIWWTLTNWLQPPTPALDQKHYILAKRADSGLLVYVYIKADMTIVMSDGWYDEVIPPQTLAKFGNNYHTSIEFGGAVLRFNGIGVFFEDISQILDCQYI